MNFSALKTAIIIVAVVLKFTVHVDQSFKKKGHTKINITKP